MVRQALFTDLPCKVAAAVDARAALALAEEVTARLAFVEESSRAAFRKQVRAGRSPHPACPSCMRMGLGIGVDLVDRGSECPLFRQVIAAGCP